MKENQRKLNRKSNQKINTRKIKENQRRRKKI